MKNKSPFYIRLKAGLVLLCVMAFSFNALAQNSAAQAQPIKKTTTAPAVNSTGNNPASWQKQPIQPGKSKPVVKTGGGETHLPPSQAQPIQGKQ